MAPRAQLQALLEQTLGSDNVYFQPPTNVQLEYPCIIYKRDSTNTIFADDLPYRHLIKYQIIIIDRNPDSLIPKEVSALPLCVYDRFYTADNLNHDVFTLFF